MSLGKNKRRVESLNWISTLITWLIGSFLIANGIEFNSGIIDQIVDSSANGDLNGALLAIPSFIVIATKVYKKFVDGTFVWKEVLRSKNFIFKGLTIIVSCVAAFGYISNELGAAIISGLLAVNSALHFNQDGVTKPTTPDEMPKAYPNDTPIL